MLDPAEIQEHIIAGCERIAVDAGFGINGNSSRGTSILGGNALNAASASGTQTSGFGLMQSNTKLLNRRGFLSLLVFGLTGAVLDQDRLLWVPGKRLISIPAEPKEEAWTWHSDPFYIPMLNGDRAGPYRIDYSTGELRFVNVSWLRKERVLTPEYIKLMYGQGAMTS